MMLFDSEFVIAMSRRPDSALRMRAETFLGEHQPAGLYISRVTSCEVAVGCENRGQAEFLLRDFTPLEINDEVAWRASRVARELKGTGLHIGDNDVWLAATALAYGLPLVSNNKRHPGRVTGLDLRGY